jgi:amino acid adenylation domain-containing protein
MDEGMAQGALSAAQRDTVLRQWNATAAAFPQCGVQQLFECQAAATPHAPALRAEGEELDYAELDARANRLAQYLRRRGVERGALVGVALRRTPQLVVALLACWKAGAAYVPLDPGYPAERLAFMADDAALALLLTETAVAPLFGARAGVLELDALAAQLASEPAQPPADGAGVDDLAYVMYTSGSTGQPKGAMITQRGLVNYLWWAIGHYRTGPGSSVPLHSSISFDLTVTSLYPALLSGGCVELLREDGGAQSLVACLRQAAPRALVKITPAHLELLTRQLDAAQARGACRAFVIGGENLSAESLQFWRDAAPQLRLINEYGPTETVVGCCVHEVAADDARAGPVAIGRPIANTELYVLDAQREPVAPGAVGELYIGGAGVARGYLNRPELTRERFVDDPFSGRAGARLYKTGDLARWRADGVLEYLGRVDHQVKVNGYRIELGEIEAVLAGCAEVGACAVVVRELTPGQRQLVAYAVARPGQHIDADALRARLRELLPDHMVPAWIVDLPELPLTRNGKVDRDALPAPQRDGGGAQPRNDAERRLCAIWAELLKLDRVAVDADLFDLGATSLSMVAAAARMRSAFGVAVDVGLLFEHSTIEALVRELGLDDASGQGAAAALARQPRDAALPLSFSQRRMWVVHHFDRKGSGYNMNVALRLRGTLDLVALQRALDALVVRHESLRTRFEAAEPEPLARIEPPAPALIERIESGAATLDARFAELRELAAARMAEPYRLTRLPLHRFVLGSADDAHHLLAIGMHHIVCDPWSWTVLLADLGALYDGVEPAARGFDFVDVAARQRATAPDATALRRRASELVDAPVLALPGDTGVTSRRSSAGRTLSRRFDAAALRRAALARGATPAALLLAACQTLLARACAQRDIALLMPVAARDDAAAEQVVGSLVNSVIVRAAVDADADVEQQLPRAREALLDALAQQALPYDELVAELRRLDPGWVEPRAMFNVLNMELRAPQLHGLDAELLSLRSDAALFDLHFSANLASGELSLSCAAELFSDAAAQSLLEDYLTLLRRWQ